MVGMPGKFACRVAVQDAICDGALEHPDVDGSSAT